MSLAKFAQSPSPLSAGVRDFLPTEASVPFHISDDKIKELFPTQNLTPDQFTFQFSDHFPLWVQIKTDIEGQRLNQIVQNARKV